MAKSTIEQAPQTCPTVDLNTGHLPSASYHFNRRPAKILTRQLAICSSRSDLFIFLYPARLKKGLRQIDPHDREKKCVFSYKIAMFLSFVIRPSYTP